MGRLLPRGTSSREDGRLAQTAHEGLATTRHAGVHSQLEAAAIGRTPGGEKDNWPPPTSRTHRPRRLQDAGRLLDSRHEDGHRRHKICASATPTSHRGQGVRPLVARLPHGGRGELLMDVILDPDKSNVMSRHSSRRLRVRARSRGGADPSCGADQPPATSAGASLPRLPHPIHQWVTKPGGRPSSTAAAEPSTGCTTSCRAAATASTSSRRWTRQGAAITGDQ